MKKILLTLVSAILVQTAIAQTAADTITTQDMPVAGDTLRYSIASNTDPNAATLINDTGANMVWDFSYLVATGSGVDSYLTATQINAYLGLLMPSAYGYKVLDSLSLPIPGAPITLRDIYTLYKNSAANYQATGFVASISGIPAPFSYTTPDHVYNFPEAYGKAQDSNIYSLTISIPSTATIKRNGYRLTNTIGYGTVKTPYYSTAQNCILIKSETHEIDSVTLTAFPVPMGLPQNNIEFQWLIKGEHYPAVDITTPYPFAGTITRITYRDFYHYFPPLSVSKPSPQYTMLTAYPVPSNDVVNLTIPADWKNYTVEVYDFQSRLVQRYENQSKISLATLAAGNYLARVICGNNNGLVHLVK
jgi:hypothetical protein